MKRHGRREATVLLKAAAGVSRGFDLPTSDRRETHTCRGVTLLNASRPDTMNLRLRSWVFAGCGLPPHSDAYNIASNVHSNLSIFMEPKPDIASSFLLFCGFWVSCVSLFLSISLPPFPLLSCLSLTVSFPFLFLFLSLSLSCSPSLPLSLSSFSFSRSSSLSLSRSLPHSPLSFLSLFLLYPVLNALLPQLSFSFLFTLFPLGRNISCPIFCPTFYL